jgi:Ca2+-binding EF-hand superfamily protein
VISKDELKKVFGEFYSEAIFGELFSEADIDKDDKISLNDFMSMMKKYTSTYL